MGDFQINVSEFRNYINYLDANRMQLVCEKAELTMQILKLRVAGNNTTTSVIRQRLGYEQRRLTKEINNIYAITNAANQIIAEAEKADKKAEHEFNNALENILEAIARVIPLPGIWPNPRPGIIIIGPIPIGPRFPEIGLPVPWNPWNPWTIRGISPRPWLDDPWSRCRREHWRRINGPLGAISNGNLFDIIAPRISPKASVSDWLFNNKNFGRHDPLGFEVNGNYRSAFREYSGNANLAGLLLNGSGAVGLNIMSGNVSGGIFNKNGYFDPRFDANGQVQSSILHGEGSFSTGDSHFGASGNFSGDVGYAEGKGNVNLSLFDSDGRLNPSVDASVSARLAAAKGEGHFQVGNDTIGLKGDVEGSVGDLNAEAHMRSGLRDANGNINPYADIGASASAKGATGKISGQFGNDHLNSHFEASGTIGGAEANAGIKFSNSGAKASVGAEAYVAKGSVSGGYNIFGLKIDGELSGKAIAAGAHAGGEVTDSSVEIDVGAALGIGGDLKVKIDWGDTAAYKIIKNPSSIRDYMPSPQQAAEYIGGAVNGVRDFGNGLANAANYIGGAWNNLMNH